MPQLLLFPDAVPAEPEPPLLTIEEQHRVLALMLRGGSPQMNCEKLRLAPAAFCRTIDEDAAFRRRVRHIRTLHTQNVVAMVYRAALSGTPAAQALWLRTFAPHLLDDSADEASSAETLDEFSECTDEDLRLQVAALRIARRPRFESEAPPGPRRTVG